MRSLHKLFLACSGLIMGVFFGAAANAQTATGNINITAEVDAKCVVRTVNMDFGVYDPTTVADAITLVETLCTNDSIAVLTLDGGSSGSVSARTLVKGADTLSYQLYLDAARTQIFGDNSGGQTLGVVGNGTVQTHEVYGRIPTGQFVTEGNYSDTVIATIVY